MFKSKTDDFFMTIAMRLGVYRTFPSTMVFRKSRGDKWILIGKENVAQ